MNPVDPSPIPSRDQVIALLSQHLPEWRRRYGIQQMSLFGSLARNEARAGSDVDLCVSLDPPNPLLLVHFQQDAEQQLGMHVDVVTRWPGMNRALKEEIERDAVSISTLSLSGRQGVWGGEAKSGRWPVHLEGLVSRPLWPHSQTV